MLPLEGITAVALAHAVAAPFCTRQPAPAALGAHSRSRLAGLGCRDEPIERWARERVV